MAFSNITLTFSRAIAVDEVINFLITDTDNLPAVNANMICKDPRGGVGQFDYTGGFDPGGYDLSMFIYRNYWSQDYSPLNEYDLVIDGNDLIITAKKNNVTFSGFSSTAGVTAVIVDGDNSVDPEVTSVTFAKKVGDECNTMVVTVVASDIIDEIEQPISTSGNGTNTLSFDYVRGQDFMLILTVGVDLVSKDVLGISLCPDPTAEIEIVGSQKNLVILAEQNGLTFQYSIDNAAYQSSNRFDDRPNGDQLFYIKDQYDCVKSGSITISDPPPPKAFHFISNLNCIRYKLNEIWDNVSKFKTSENTLSCEEDTPLIYPYTQRFQKNDNPVTQIKTNYVGVSAKIVENNGLEHVLNVIKKTNYIDKKEALDGKKIQVASGLWGFYFLSGSVYDYDTNAVTGTYELNGELPDWAKVGNSFTVGLVSYFISSIVFDETVNAFVILTGSDLSLLNDDEVVKSIYDVFNYEAYHFEVSMFAMLNKEFQVHVNLTDARYDDVEYISEKITSEELLDDLLSFKFWNRSNNDILYKLSDELIITHILRLDYDLFGNAGEAETDILIGDSDSYINSSQYTPKKEVNFTYLTTKMVEKVQQALSLSHLFIKGNSYIAENIEKPFRIGVSNFYNLKATLVKSSKIDATLACEENDYIDNCYIDDYYE